MLRQNYEVVVVATSIHKYYLPDCTSPEEAEMLATQMLDEEGLSSGSPTHEIETVEAYPLDQEGL